MKTASNVSGALILSRREAMAALAHAGDDSTRPHLSAVTIDHDRGSYSATDGHRLAIGIAEYAQGEPRDRIPRAHPAPGVGLVARDVLAAAIKACDPKGWIVAMPDPARGTSIDVYGPHNRGLGLDGTIAGTPIARFLGGLHEGVQGPPIAQVVPSYSWERVPDRDPDADRDTRDPIDVPARDSARRVCVDPDYLTDAAEFVRAAHPDAGPRKGRRETGIAIHVPTGPLDPIVIRAPGVAAFVIVMPRHA